MTDASSFAETSDASRHLRKLEILISKTTRGVLAFVLYRSVSEREAAVRALRNALSLPVAEFFLSPENDDPIRLLFTLPETPRACVFFHDAENAMANRTEDGRPHLAGYVNLQRERLLEVPHAVIFCVRENGLREIAIHAPDFFSWSSGTFDVRTNDIEAAPGFVRLLMDEPFSFRDREEAERKISLYRGLLEEYGQAETPDEVFLADLSAKLGRALCEMGRYAEAEEPLKRALEIRERILGVEHPVTATNLNNLAELYGAQGNYAKALPLFGRALAIWEKAFGAEHPDTARGLNNLAALYQAQGEYAQALPLLERSLVINEKALGAGHPETATNLNNLAGLYYAQGEYAQALPLLERSLAITEKTLGAEHPDTAMSLNNLAALYYAQGEYAKALPLFERALAVWEKTLGAEHPNTKAVIENLASLRDAMRPRPESADGAGNRSPLVIQSPGHDD